MSAVPPADHLSQPVLGMARPVAVSLHPDLSVDEALAEIRRDASSGVISYNYVVDAEGRLAGVLPVRRLVTATPGQFVKDVMLRQVHSLPHTATVLDACEAFAMHKLLAFPIVDGGRRLLGVVEVGLFTDEVFEVAERERLDEVFESIGFRVAQVRDAGPLKAWRYRFPWLLATLTSGLACAVLTGLFQATLAESIALAFFMTLMLGLGESVSVQTMTLTIQALRGQRPTWRWFRKALIREAGSTLLLGASCSVLAGLAVLAWLGEALTALVVAGSVVLIPVAAAGFGLVVPAVLHRLRLDPKIAAGPVTLALADLATLTIYFMLAAVLL